MMEKRYKGNFDIGIRNFISKLILLRTLLRICLFFFIITFFLSNTVVASTFLSDTTQSYSPVTFLRNEGQWPAEILFRGLSTTTNVYLLQDGLSFAQAGEEIEYPDGTEEYPYIVWNMKFINQSPATQIIGDNGNESVISFLYGNDPGKWVIHPSEFKTIIYKNVFQNINLKFYGDEYNLKYDFIVKPGGDINSIAAAYEGIESLSISSAGELLVHNLWNTQIQKAPIAWQIINEVKSPVAIEYTLINDTTFSFIAPTGYDNNYELIIDPLFQMIWGSYTKALGSSDNINYCFDNAMDTQGNVYLTGMVDGTYPITPGVYSGPGSIVPEIFVSKFSSDGTTLLYSTYISGSSTEYGLAIAVDNIGRAYITGLATSNWTGGNTYPTTSSAYQAAIYPSGGEDVIFTVLNSTGTGLVYSTFLGGNNDDQGYDITIGNDGMVYITGATKSSNFPVKGSSLNQTSTQDVFVAKFDITKSGLNSLVYSVRISGNGFSIGRGIVVNNNGNAFITGSFLKTGSVNYPLTTGAYNPVYNGGFDNSMVIVSKLSATTPVSLVYSTYIGSGSGNGIALSPNTDEAFITGCTRTFSFPVTSGVIQPVHGQDALGNSNGDAFVAKLNSTGTSLIYSTFLGGATEDNGTGISVNALGEGYVTGMATSGFPTSLGALQPNNAGSKDFFVVHLNSAATGYGCGGSTFIGGDDSDYNSNFYDYVSPRISLRDHSGNNDTLSISGTSHSTNFPTTPGAYGPVKLNGIADQPVFFKLTCLTSVSLPIELLSFTAELIEGNKVLCKWSTASEMNNDFFTLQKSRDGFSFEIIGVINGASNSNSVLNYSFVDFKPFSGTSYYRLKQTDFDGKSSYSKLVSILNHSTKEDKILIYSNPTFEKIYLNIDSYTEVVIYDPTGRKIKSFENKNILDVNDLNSGLYLLIILDKEGKVFYSQKINIM